MEFKDFTNKMAAAVKERMGEGYQVSVQTVKKNNNITLKGLLIIGKESNVTPMIYLEPFYHAVAGGRATMGQAASDIVDFYKEHKVSRPVDASPFTDYGNIRGRIRARLVNTGKNQDFLATVPHREYMDLSMIYAAVFDCEDGEQGSIIVKHEHMKLWGVTEQELFEQAESNTEAADDMEVISMSEIFRQTAGDEAAGEIGIMDCGAAPMYVVTNKKRLYGAVAMLNRKVMKKAAEILGRDFIILPSSIHEVLAVAATDVTAEVCRMAWIVNEVNSTEVAEDEILSGHVYRYDCQTGEIVIAA